jgi:hypothetical protein
VDLACLEQFLALSNFRSETLEMLHKAGDTAAATDLLSCTAAAENALTAAQSYLDEAKGALRQPPSLVLLAELFNALAPMDGEVTKAEMLQVLAKVPVGPAKDVEASLSGDKSSKFGFAAFTRRIYGSPTNLGWWPSLMEDTACMWCEASFQELKPPSLQDLLFYYELGAEGTSGVTSEGILKKVLPAWQQPVEGEAVEDLFAEIRGDTPLSFKHFAIWMRRYFEAVLVASHQKQAEEGSLQYSL